MEMGRRLRGFSCAAKVGVFVATVMLTLSLPAIAFAANTATFSGATPTPGSSLAVPKPTSISVVVYDKYGVSSTSQYSKVTISSVKGIVGPRVARVFTRISGSAKFSLTYAVGTALSVGPHYVSVRITDLQGHVSIYNWAFTVTAAPSGAETVTFNNEGGIPSSASAAVAYDTAFGANMPAAPTKTGYTFAGYNTAADGLVLAFTSATLVTASTTVYAQWTPVTAPDVHTLVPPYTAATVGCFVAGCHTGGTSLSMIHLHIPGYADQSGCTICHGGTIAPTADCATVGCHSPSDAYPVAAPHDIVIAEWSSSADLHAASPQMVLGSVDHNSAEVPKDNCLLCHSAFQFYQYNGVVDPSGATTGSIPSANLGAVDWPDTTTPAPFFYCCAVSHFVSPMNVTGPWTISNATDWQATTCSVCHNPAATNQDKLAKFGAILDTTFLVGGAQQDHFTGGSVGYFDPSVASSAANGMPDSQIQSLNDSMTVGGYIATTLTLPVTSVAGGCSCHTPTALSLQAEKVCDSCHNAADQGSGDASVTVSTTQTVDFGPQGGDSRAFVLSNHANIPCIDCHQGHTFAAPTWQEAKVLANTTPNCSCHKDQSDVFWRYGIDVVHTNHLPTDGSIPSLTVTP